MIPPVVMGPWRFDWLRDDARAEQRERVAVVVTVLAWLASVAAPAFGASPTWSAVPLVLAFAWMASPAGGARGGLYAGWWSFAAAGVIGLVTAIYADARPGAEAGLACGVVVVQAVLGGVALPVAGMVGRAVYEHVGPGSSLARALARAAVALAALALAVNLARVPGRVNAEAFDAGGHMARAATVVAFGGRCPPTCDVGADGRRMPAVSSEMQLADGLALRRARLDALSSRVELVSGGRSVWSARAVGAQRVEVYLDRRAAYARIEHLYHPSVLLRVSDGARWTARRWGAAAAAFVHAPWASLLVAALGLAGALVALRLARRARDFVETAPSWKAATMSADGRLVFEAALPPAPPMRGDLRPGPVTVTRFEAPLGVAFRSDNMARVDEVYQGTPEEVREEAERLAFAWELSAAATAVLTAAPLVGAGLTWAAW